MNFTEAVKAAMQKLGIKIPEIAKRTGFSYQYIHDLLSGERRWNEDTINKVCDALGIQVTFEQKGEEASDIPFADPEGAVDESHLESSIAEHG